VQRLMPHFEATKERSQLLYHRSEWQRLAHSGPFSFFVSLKQAKSINQTAQINQIKSMNPLRQPF
jgi:hypothetical protein